MHTTHRHKQSSVLNHFPTTLQNYIFHKHPHHNNRVPLMSRIKENNYVTFNDQRSSYLDNFTLSSWQMTHSVDHWGLTQLHSGLDTLFLATYTDQFHLDPMEAAGTSKFLPLQLKAASKRRQLRININQIGEDNAHTSPSFEVPYFSARVCGSK